MTGEVIAFATERFYTRGFLRHFSGTQGKSATEITIYNRQRSLAKVPLYRDHLDNTPTTVVRVVLTVLWPRGDGFYVAQNTGRYAHQTRATSRGLKKGETYHLADKTRATPLTFCLIGRGWPFGRPAVFAI